MITKQKIIDIINKEKIIHCYGEELINADSIINIINNKNLNNKILNEINRLKNITWNYYGLDMVDKKELISIINRNFI